jgi:hypothetical protein
MVPFSDVLEAQALRQQSRARRIDLVADYWVKRATYLRSIAADEELPVQDHRESHHQRNGARAGTAQ